MATQSRSNLGDTPSLDDFLPRGEEGDDGPVILAAEDADSSILHSYLEKAQELPASYRSEYVLNQVHDASLDGRWDSPLLRAVSASRADNVRLLLRYGADPNGVPKNILAEYSRHFRRLLYRGPPGAEVAARMDVWVTLTEGDVGSVERQVLPSSLTEHEISASRECVSPFWDDVNIPGLGLSGNEGLLHSLVMAAGKATAEIFDELVEAGADAQFWKMESEQATEAFANATSEAALGPSALCVSTPLHAAITAGNTNMLKALLDRGLDPNSRAMIVGPKALTPAQYAITLGNLEAYTVLASHPRANPSILTPMYKVRTQHFAVARLMPEELIQIEVPLLSVPATSLGHTLLHVACLPLDESCLESRAEKVRRSLHFVRQFAFEDTQTPLLPPDHKAQQKQMCKWLVSTLGAAELGKADVHGNTALHYLAGTRSSDTELVAWMKDMAEDAIWAEKRNFWGMTPEDLWRDAKAAEARSLSGDRGRGMAARGRGRESGRVRGVLQTIW